MRHYLAAGYRLADAQRLANGQAPKLGLSPGAAAASAAAAGSAATQPWDRKKVSVVEQDGDNLVGSPALFVHQLMQIMPSCVRACEGAYACACT